MSFIPVTLANERVNALIDTGSMISLVSAAFFQKLHRKRVRKTGGAQIICVTANGTTMTANRVTSLTLKVGDWSWVHSFYICPLLNVDVIIGRDFQHRSGMIIDSKVASVYFSFAAKQFPFINIPTRQQVKCCYSEVTSPPDFQGLIAEFSDVVNEKVGRTHLIEYRIETSDNKPVRVAPFGMAPPQLHKMNLIIENYLNDGVIRKSTSPYSSPAFLVKGKTGKDRMVVDYRRVNEKVVIENFPMPTIESVFQHLSGAKYFTILDLNSAYHQIPLDPKSRQKTSFSTPQGQYEFNYLPMGLSVSGSVFCRLMDTVLGDIKYKFVYPYVDDLCIFSKTLDEHYEHVREVLIRLRAAKLTLNPQKITIAQKSVKFLGMIISERGLTTDPQKVSDIVAMAPPSNVKALSRFLGMVSFYSRFIPNFSAISLPLNRLKRKNVVFAWGEQEQKSFEQLRKALTTPPVLHFPNFNEKFIVSVDASKSGLGCVLQQHVNGALAPIAYASRTLNPAEANTYNVYELECLGAVFAVEKFHSYLESREFVLETDNAALSWLKNSPQRPDKVARWILRLSRYKFTIKHVRGVDNPVADCLSRLNPDEGTTEGAAEIPTEIVMHTPLTTIPPEIVMTQALFQFPSLLNSIVDEQDADVDLALIKRELRNNRPRENYSLSGNTLLFKPNPNRSKKVVIPSNLKAVVIKFFHDSPLAGHLGQFKTFNKISRDYYWPQMRRDIFHYVRTCPECQRTKPRNVGPVGLMASTPSTYCNEKLYIDYFGPLPRASGGDVHVLIIIDAFSKWVEMFPVKRIGTARTNDILISEMFLRYGPPKYLASDNASIFRARKFREMCLSWGIKHVKTTTHHPQANMVERVNRNLKYALTIYVEHDHTTWDLFLPYLRYAFNSSTHETTLETAGKLFLGRDLSNPLRNAWNIDALLQGDPGDADQRTQEEVRDAAIAATRLARERTAKHYNQGRRPHAFRVGQLVVLQTHTLSNAGANVTSKFSAKWSKPMRIIRLTTPVNLECESVDTGEIKKVHVDQCKPYYGRL
jgi:RNase H-like domain found in reverse transcriptase/Reverse transcriptase (RNA-dependent DNA polymerase)/Integrase zinc binding domain/Integrase core domain/Aspartyl protease